MDRAKIIYLYELYRESRISEDVPNVPFLSLSPREQIAWGKFCRDVDREYRFALARTAEAKEK
jgi:hypothetical protein